MLGPPDGRYLVRDHPQAPLEAVLVLRDARRSPGVAPARRRGRELSDAAEPDVGPADARRRSCDPSPSDRARRPNAWLDGLQREPERSARRARSDAIRVAQPRPARTPNRGRRPSCDRRHGRARVRGAHRLRRRRGGRGRPLRARLGAAAQRAAPTRVRSMEAPEEHFAAVLGGRERALACEELVLRAASGPRRRARARGGAGDAGRARGAAGGAARRGQPSSPANGPRSARQPTPRSRERSTSVIALRSGAPSSASKQRSGSGD